MKKALSVLLALLLLLGLSIPVLAAETADPNAPIITRQPQSVSYVIRLIDGIPWAYAANVVLSIEAELPDGVEGVLSYAWYHIHPDTGAHILQSPNGPIFEWKASSIDNGAYYVVVTTTWWDDLAVAHTASAQSDTAVVETTPSTALRLAESLYPIIGYPLGALEWLLTMVLGFPFVLLFGLWYKLGG